MGRPTVTVILSAPKDLASAQGQILRCAQDDRRFSAVVGRAVPPLRRDVGEQPPSTASGGGELYMAKANPLGLRRQRLARPGDARALALFGLAQFRRESLAEVGRLVDLADFDFGFVAEREWIALHPLDHLLFRVCLQDPETGDQL